MPTRLSNYFLRTLREDPADAEVASHRLLVRAGYIRRQAPGVFAWLPIGLRVKARIEEIIREEMTAAGAHEVHFPALLPREPYEVTNRWTEYGDGLFRLKDRKDADYLLAPTHEEVFTLLVKDLYSSYKDLPLTIYQIQDKYRDEARPRAGLLRGREFTMKDAYSFDVTDAGLDASYQAQRDAYERIFARLGLEYVIVKADAGAMGGSKSEEFLHPSPVGEDTFVRSAGGYAANVEAYTTTPPEPIPFDGLPAPLVLDSPNTPTIATLVDLANAEYPRPDGRPWTAADTLKNVVLALTHLDGTRELVVVGLPGDRDVELKRVEVAFAPADGRGRHRGRLREAPRSRQGLHRPVVARGRGARRGVRHRHPLLRRPARRRRHRVDHRRQPRREARASDSSRAATSSPTASSRPPTCAPATPRPTAPARSSSPAASRSGTCSSSAASTPTRSASRCSTRTASSPPSRWARTASASPASSRSSPRATTTTRASSGPRRSPRSTCTCSRPARTTPCSTPAESIIAALEAAGFDVLYDDRPKVSPGVKFGDAELIGVPKIVIAGRGVAEGVVEVWDRASGDRVTVPIDDVVATLGG